jgi:hypothetical protein
MAHTLKIVDQIAARGQKRLTKTLITRKITYIYQKKFQQLKVPLHPFITVVREEVKVEFLNQINIFISLKTL